MKAKQFLNSAVNQQTGTIFGLRIGGDMFASCCCEVIDNLTRAVNGDAVLTKSQQSFVDEQVRDIFFNALVQDISFSDAQKHHAKLWSNYSSPKLLQLAIYINSCR